MEACAVYNRMDQQDIMGTIIGKVDFEAPVGLAGRVFIAIERHRRKMAMIGAAVYAATAAGATAVFVVAWRFASAEFDRAGVSQLLALLRSDFRTVLMNGGDFAMSVMEALPVMPTVYALLSATAVLALSSTAAEYIKKINGQRITNNHVRHA